MPLSVAFYVVPGTLAPMLAEAPCVLLAATLQPLCSQLSRAGAVRAAQLTHDHICGVQRHHLLKPNCNDGGLMLSDIQPRAQVQLV